MTKTEVRLLLLGLDNAGKTTTLEQCKIAFDRNTSRRGRNLQPDRILPTIGLNIGRLQVQNADVTVWDLGGQNSFRSIWDKYYSDAHGVVFVVDSSDYERFSEAAGLLERLIRHERAQGLPILILANKQDMEEARSPEDVAAAVSMQELQSNSSSCQLLPIAALTGHGVRVALDSFVARLLSQGLRELSGEADESTS